MIKNWNLKIQMPTNQFQNQ